MKVPLNMTYLPKLRASHSFAKIIQTEEALIELKLFLFPRNQPKQVYNSRFILTHSDAKDDICA